MNISFSHQCQTFHLFIRISIICIAVNFQVLLPCNTFRRVYSTNDVVYSNYTPGSYIFLLISHSVYNLFRFNQ